MIKATCYKGDVDIKITGNLAELMADTMTLVRSIWLGIKDESPLCGVLYQSLIAENIADAFVDGPLDNENMFKTANLEGEEDDD